MRHNQSQRGPDRRRRVTIMVLLALSATLLLLTRPVLAQDGINTGTVQINSGTTFYVAGQLTNNSSSAFTNAGDVVIAGSLNFQNGKIDEPTNGIVIFRDNATATNAADASHVDGPVRKIGNDAFTFPTGDGGQYGPIGISAPAAATDQIDARYWLSNPQTDAGTALGAGLTAVSSVEYWNVSGTPSINLTLYWDSGSNLNALTGGNLANLSITGWNGSQWVSLGAGTTTGDTTSGTITVNTVTPNSYQAYTFAAAAPVAVTLPVKVLLQGAYDSVSGQMRDQLRSLNSFPLTSPYGDGAVIASSSVLTANNIVDWVLIELRGTGALSTTVVASKGALLQRDGDVVGVDGVSTLSFTGLSGSSYHVVVRHRNHLGIMTANPVTLSASTPVVDFTSPSTAVFVRTRTVAQKLQSGKMLLWGGDANGDGDVKGAGPGTDPGSVRQAVLSHPGNTTFAANYIAVGYAKADVTLNGQTIGAGSGNEISNVILPNVLSHPGNPTLQNNYIICQQLPEDPCN